MWLTIIVFIIVLGLIVLVHELGHFWTARKLGVKVEEFGFGFPPRIFGRKHKGVIYSLNWIPLGGFVKIKGEAGEAKDDPDSFSHQSAGRRTLILSAGVIMNVLFAFVLLTAGFMIGLPSVVDDLPAGARVDSTHIQIVQVEPDSVAQNLALQLGDEIVSIDEQQFSSVVAITDYIRNDQDKILALQLKRYGEDLHLTADLTSQDVPVLGVYLAKTGLVHYPWYQAIWEGAQATVNVLWQIVYAFYSLLAGLLSGAGTSLQVAGPVGVAVMTGQMAKLGFVYLLQFAALLSLNLAIINILPFPALDGGRILFVIIEKIRRRPNNEMIEAVIHNIGFFLLIFLMFVVTYKDLARYGGRIWGVFSGWFG
ncbi:MAG: RIP metalloprotease RseP [Candidatus Komeilibacteria bacterium]